MVTFLVDLFFVAVGQSLDLFLQLLLLGLGLFLQVGLICAHGQSQSVCVLLRGRYTDRKAWINIKS